MKTSTATGHTPPWDLQINGWKHCSPLANCEACWAGCSFPLPSIRATALQCLKGDRSTRNTRVLYMWTPLTHENSEPVPSEWCLGVIQLLCVSTPLGTPRTMWNQYLWCCWSFINYTGRTWPMDSSSSPPPSLVPAELVPPRCCAISKGTHTGLSGVPPWHTIIIGIPKLGFLLTTSYWGLFFKMIA